MSTIYIPELMELDSYWQKAVEDAIRDTLKGEKRLHYALKKRKKVNQKLERLGLTQAHSQTHFSYLPLSKSESMEEQDISESDSENSRSSIEDEYRGIDNNKSRSRSENHRDPPFTEKHKNPERPLLGDGSLEKMKKSQNSFNCEPMGVENLNEELSEYEKEDDVDYNVNSKKNYHDERNKKIQWLHIRDDSDFEGSDAESANNVLGDEDSEENELPVPAALAEKNYFVNEKSDSRLPQRPRRRKNSEIQKNVTPKDLFWEKEVENAIKKNISSQRRLQMTLAKRGVLKKNLKTSTIRCNSNATEANLPEKSDKKHMSPFIKFYLDVYRELGHKYSTSEITKEAARRWRAMNKAEKSNYFKSRHKFKAY